MMGPIILRPLPTPIWFSPLCLKMSFFYNGKFYFWLRQLIAIRVSVQLCCDCQGEESTPGRNILHYSQILPLGKIYYFSELREEFIYFLVCSLF